jgi:hypothetical protein
LTQKTCPHGYTETCILLSEQSLQGTSSDISLYNYITRIILITFFFSLKTRNMLEKIAISFVFCVLTFLNPLSNSFFEYIFSPSLFEELSAWEMTTFLMARIPETFAQNFLLFIIAPALILLFKYLVDRSRLTQLSTRTAQLISIAALPVNFYIIQNNTENFLARTFVMDIFQMFLWQITLVVVGQLSWKSLFFGPLFGLASHIRSDESQKTSIFWAAIVLFLSIPTLYNMFVNDDTEVPFKLWQGFELYSIFTIVSSFVLLILCQKTPESFQELARFALILLILHANVACGWICMTSLTKFEEL